MMNLICVGDGDIPVLMEIVSANQSDKARFAQLFQDFSQQWTFEGLCVATCNTNHSGLQSSRI
jgi:transposase